MQQKEARRFSELLAEAAEHSRLLVLMSARSDFLGRLQADRRLSEQHPKLLFDVRQHVDISPLDESGLIDVVCRPAETLGVSFETGLDKTLIAVTRKEIGGLPLLSYTLETLWQDMQARKDSPPVLRWNGPLGEPIDIARKLADRANTFLAQRQGQEEVIRRLFCVRLAHVPQQGEPTRQRALLSKLSDAERELVLVASEQRILVTGQSDEGQPIAEVAHEKLFTAWTTLRNWIESRRAFYAWATQIAATRREWEKAGLSSEHLLMARPLERGRYHLDHDGEDIPREDRHFVTVSISADKRRKANEAERERTIARRTMAGLVIASTLGVIAAIGGGYANFQRKEAQQHASNAVAALNEALLTQSRFLAEQSSQATDRGDAGTGVLLALEALPDEQSDAKTAKERPYWGPTESALEKSWRALREEAALAGHELQVSNVAVMTGGRIVTVSYDKTARIWDVASGRELFKLTEGKSLLSDGKHAEAQAKFAEARRLDLSLGMDIDRLLAEAAKQKDAR